MNETPDTETVIVEVTVNESHLELHLQKIAIDCAREIVSGAVGELLNVHQRESREDERERVGGHEDTRA